MKEFTLQGVHYRLAEHPEHPRLVRFLPDMSTAATVAHFGAGYDPTEVLATARADRAAMASCPWCEFPRAGYAHSPGICREREATFT